MRKKSIILTLLLLTALITLYTLTQKTYAQETVLKIVGPSEVGPPGQSFNVSIIAENIPADNGMYGWEIVVKWTPGLINCTAETLNYNIWPAFLGPWVSKPIDNVNGKYWQSLTARAPSTPVSGTYWLVNLTFLVIGNPCNDVPLTFELPPGYTAYCLLNQYSEEIPHQFQPSTSHIVPEFTPIFMVATLVIAVVSTGLTKKFLRKA
jgi:hypothetical protein